MIEALYYRKLNGRVECLLCPHQCLLKPGATGICRVRKNHQGTLMAENYGKVCSVNADPIEKKPLYHFFPGRNILSVGGIGCNLRCRFCQNWEISQASMKNFSHLMPLNTEKIVALALSEADNTGVAYTYNEPLVWIEFMLDIARQIKKKNLKNVMVTNGFINPDPLQDLLNYMDAFSVDLKGFSDEFYKKLTGGELKPVLETLKTIRKSGRHLEITNLVVPNHNDNPEAFTAMIDWIAEELGENTVLHISRYHPSYRQEDPITPEGTLVGFYKVARQRLNHVYLGNIRTLEGQNTYCPSCNTLAIRRAGYNTERVGMNHSGLCLDCGASILKKENVLIA